MEPFDVQGLRQYAEKAAPFEFVGYIALDGHIVPFENVAKDRTKNFLVRPDELVRMQRAGYLGICHSHVDQNAYLSNEDVEGANDFGKLYVVASVIKGFCNDVQVFLLAGAPGHKKFIRL